MNLYGREEQQDVWTSSFSELQSTNDYGNHALKELRDILPTVANKLNTTVDRLSIICLNMSVYISPAYLTLGRNIIKLEHVEGNEDRLPFIYTSTTDTYCGIGLTILKNINNNITYAIYSTLEQPMNSPYNHKSFLIAVKGDIHKILHSAQTSQNNEDQLNPPILERGLLNKILDNTLEFLKYKRRFKKYKIKPKRGLLLYGPPGNGKTLICKYIRQMCQNKGIGHATITTSQIEEAFEHDNLEKLLSKTTVLFFDDIDISYLNRNSGNGKMACSILSAMDGIKGHDNQTNIIKIFTSNEDIMSMDPAFKRPGRIDCVFEIKKPTRDLRSKLIKTWHEDIVKALHNDNSMTELLNQTEGFSFAELHHIYTIMTTNKISNHKINVQQILEEYYNHKVQEQNVKKVGFFNV